MRLLVFSCLVLSAGAIAAPVQGQVAPVVSQPVVQAIPGSGQAAGSQNLNAALARLGRNPRDVNAMVDAGNAALALGDVEAAVGFFSRADQVMPNSPRVRAGLAGALVHSGNPYDAIPLFTEAEAAGGMDPELNSERGLAYDLVGDNASAQRYYRAALGLGPNDEASRRLGLSLAISGDAAGMESALAPLLLRGDKASIRVHAFGLAILGRQEDAVAIAYRTMPQDLAAGIAPYLRYMPRLTHAQQAAAATFGNFPRAAEIGHDDPRALRFQPPTHVATAETSLTPQGDPLGGRPGSQDKGRKGKDKSKDRDKSDKSPQLAAAAPRAAPPSLAPSRIESETPSALAQPVPERVVPSPAAPQERPAAPLARNDIVRPPAAQTSVSGKPSAGSQMNVAVPASVQGAGPTGPSTVVPQAASSTPPPPTAIASNSFDLGQVGRQAPAPAPAPAPTAAQPAPAPIAVPPPSPAAASPKGKIKAPSFSEAFGDIGAPVAKPGPIQGAVDVRKLPAAKAKLELAKPVNPSRIWVQVGTGRDKSALSFTWRGLVKDVPELLRGKSPSITEWGRTNRLLTGPFDNEAAASSFLARLKKQEVDAFLWTSPTGQIVDPLMVR